MDLINYPHLNCISFLDEWKEMLGLLYHYNVILIKSINLFNIFFSFTICSLTLFSLNLFPLNNQCSVQCVVQDKTFIYINNSKLLSLSVWYKLFNLLQGTVQYNTVHYNKTSYCTALYRILLYSMVQYNEEFCTIVYKSVRVSQDL